ncbi:hypothetical protein H1R17_02315 [Flavobacterium sp. xlx-214]|uniref:hypothetical protein n=1 Tax=unclassified Flavobacterium TaxID=196869 RepID=UPI0013D6175E|nr:MULTISPECIES: hypothetical protein [unclassified Flavobacterium]MBA5794084.1 hypothetical protein [Flavobacterium sp. xlx-221]QMI83993.1 hypothetical protein H1R17_02315 [Flavobacterium sp. xlx-214]
MKTLYTLLLAFGLCFTVHAQSNVINNYNQLTGSAKASVDNALNANYYKLLIQEGFTSKYLGDQANEKSVEIVGLNSLLVDNFNANEIHFNNSKIIFFNNINSLTNNIVTVNLSNAANLQYVVFTSQIDIPNVQLQQWIGNLNLPSTTQVIYRKIVLN